MSVVILDTGCANLSSVYYALQRLGYQTEVSCHPEHIRNAEKIFIPGVGTVQTAMEQLKQHELIKVIKNCTQPVLGICLGMQLLASSSEERCGIQTLDIINTSVKKISYFPLPLPHIGWNQVTEKVENCIFRGIDDGTFFYFVHSYAIPICLNTIAQTNYGELFSAAVQKNNFFGVQFHPERSGEAGAQLLKNFLEI